MKYTWNHDNLIVNHVNDVNLQPTEINISLHSGKKSSKQTGYTQQNEQTLTSFVKWW